MAKSRSISSSPVNSPKSIKPRFTQLIFKIIPLQLTVTFPAYLNTISSRFAPNWQDFTEIGRADSKVLLASFAKDVDLNFTVVAEGGRSDTQSMFNKLDDLAKGTLPNYFEGNKGFQGNFVNFTIGDIYINEIGYINSLDYQWENDKTSWIDNLPVLTTVNMTLRWIGKKMPSAAENIFSNRT
jgi:hypothetical protein